MARTDDIDDVVSSVRDFVSYRDRHKSASRILRDKLLLTQEQRVTEVAPSSDDVDNVHNLETARQDDRAGLEATIAELEAAVTAQSDDWEPDEGENFAQAAWAVSAFKTPVEVVSESVAEVFSEPEPELAPEPIDKDVLETAIVARVTAGLDDDALRALVVATVHQELSGELGERITRNVRKLVRREINRVLTSREMGQD